MKKIKYTIAIATFRRPAYLADLLRDLSQQKGDLDFSDWEVLVCDNDGNETGKGVFENAKLEKWGGYKYFTVKEQNISLARNKLFDEAEGEALIYIDDDQRVKSSFCSQVDEFWKGWKDKISGAKFHVTPIFEGAVPTDLMRELFLGSQLPRLGEKLRGFGCGGSIILRSRLKSLGRPFDPAFGLSGGEDYKMFLELTNRGDIFVSADSIQIYERVPEKRMSLIFLTRRNLYGAVNYGRLLREGLIGNMIGVQVVLIGVKAFLALLILPFGIFFGFSCFLKILLVLINQVGKLCGFFNFSFDFYK